MPQAVKKYWNLREDGTTVPTIDILPCVCGQLPSYYSSCGGFNFYGYYKCDTCNIFVTGRHDFPSIGVPGFGDNENNESKLFAVYRDEHNPENGWNKMMEAKHLGLGNGAF
jgi:hypothetical protein